MLVERVELELVERVERPVTIDIETHSAVRSMMLVKADEYRQRPRTRGSCTLQCQARSALRRRPEVVAVGSMVVEVDES